MDEVADILANWGIGDDLQMLTIEGEHFISLLRTAYGPALGRSEGDRLLRLAYACFSATDDLYAWPNVELWSLLEAAEQRIAWLEDLFAGYAPADWPLPETAARHPHVRDPVRRKMMGLDRPPLPLKSSFADRVMWQPRRHIARIRRLLSAVLASDVTPPQIGNMDQALVALAKLRQAIRDAAAGIAPPRSQPSAAKLAELREWCIAEGRTFELLDEETVLRNVTSVQAGRREAPAPLIILVRELAVSWSMAVGRLPRFVNPPRATSPEDEEFFRLLRALEIAFRRSGNELGKAVVVRALSQARDSLGREERQ